MAKQTSVISASQPSAWVFCAPLTTIFIWSGNTIVTKMAVGVIAPSAISFYRWALALLILLPIVGPSAWRNRAAARKVWKELLLGGVLGMVVYQYLSYVAAETTTAVNIGVIQALMPLLSIILASFLASEKLTIMRVVGGVISIYGLVYLTSKGNLAGLMQGDFHAGDGLMLIAILANSLYSVLLRRWALTLPIWEQIFWQIAAATIVLIPIWLLGPISPINSDNISLVLFAAIAASLIAPTCWMYGINRLGASRTALTMNLLPITVALMAWIIIDEHLEVYHYIGGGVTLFGVIVGLFEWKTGRAGRDKTAKEPEADLLAAEDDAFK